MTNDLLQWIKLVNRTGLRMFESENDFLLSDCTEKESGTRAKGESVCVCDSKRSKDVCITGMKVRSFFLRSWSTNVSTRMTDESMEQTSTPSLFFFSFSRRTRIERVEEREKMEQRENI